MVDEFVLEHGDKIAAGLRAAPADMKRELRKSSVTTAKLAGGWTRTDARRGSRQQAHMAGGIGWSGNSGAAVMTLKNTRGAPGALGAFMGSRRYRQFPAAIAPGWVPFGPGGPLVINPSLRTHEPKINDVFLAGQAAALTRALRP